MCLNMFLRKLKIPFLEFWMNYLIYLSGYQAGECLCTCEGFFFIIILNTFAKNLMLSWLGVKFKEKKLIHFEIRL